MKRHRVRSLVANTAVAVLTAVTLVPLVWMVTVSFMPRGASSHFPPPFWPERWS